MPDLQRIDFHGHKISTCQDEQTGKVYCLPREIASQVGMNWSGQHVKLTQSALYKKHTRYQGILTPGGSQEMMLLDIEYLPAWLSSISPEKVHEDIRDKLIMYQEECAQTLRDYWFAGQATNPRAGAVGSPLDAYPEMKAIVEMAHAMAEQRQISARLLAEQDALKEEQAVQREAIIAAQAQTIEALTTGHRAEAKADRIIEDMQWVSIRQYVYTARLARQMPDAFQREYGLWLADYCLQRKIPTYEAKPLRQLWAVENTYPLAEIHATLPSWLKRRTSQMTLIQQGGSHA